MKKIRQELHGVIFKDPMTQGGEENGWVTADEISVRQCP